jgi:rhodanese-related sulfurtransferase
LLETLKKIIFNRETWKGVAFILILSVVLGVAINFSLIKRFLAGEFQQAFISSQEYPGLVFITLNEAEDLWFNQQAIILDSRSEAEFAEGHIPGALSIPLEKIKTDDLAIISQLPQDKPLMIYCEGGDCLTSLNLARILYQRGFLDLRVFSGGWKEWMAAGLPTERAKGYDKQ